MSIEGKFLSKEISDLFWKEGLTLATAESCTAGNVAAAITSIHNFIREESWPIPMKSRKICWA